MVKLRKHANNHANSALTEQAEDRPLRELCHPQRSLRADGKTPSWDARSDSGGNRKNWRVLSDPLD